MVSKWDQDSTANTELEWLSTAQEKVKQKQLNELQIDYKSCKQNEIDVEAFFFAFFLLVIC